MNKQITRQPPKSTKPTKATKQERRRDRREEQARREAERRQQAARNRAIIIGSIIAAVVLITGVIIYVVYANGQGQSQTQTRQVVNPAYQPVDGVYCDQGEQSAFHIHAHLTIYVNGQPVPVAQGVGIPTDNSCLYWLHTHDTTGVVHIEAPANHSFTVGQFIDIWATNFQSSGYPPQLDLSGWTAYVNGKLYTGDFHKIPLQAHTLITLAYNTPNVKPDTTYDWGSL